MTSAASVSNPILLLDRVRKAFAGHTAVDDLSLAVPAGVIYGLLGPNGAGKTTTIRMIMDILQPDAGSVRLFGAPAGGRSNAERIGYLPEERGLYRKMRVLDVLVFLGDMKHTRGGHHLVVGFDGSVGAAARVFADASLVKKVDDYGQYAEVELAPGADPQRVLRDLVASGARLARFELREPSLLKIFIDLVGPEAAQAGVRPDA